MAERKERKVGRPSRGDSRTVEKRVRNRAPVGGYRDKLTVHGQDPDYSYRWVLSSTEDSGRILQLLDRGYEFADSDSHSFGQSHVYKTEDGSSIIRVPAGKGDGYLYLMRIKKEWYEEDQREKAKEIKNEYEAVNDYVNTENSEGDSGVYGKVEIK